MIRRFVEPSALSDGPHYSESRRTSSFVEEQLSKKQQPKIAKLSGEADRANQRSAMSPKDHNKTLVVIHVGGGILLFAFGVVETILIGRHNIRIAVIIFAITLVIALL